MDECSTETLWWIDVGYACYGIKTRGAIVVAAAPIAKWMLGKPLQSIANWVANKNGTLEKINLTN